MRGLACLILGFGMLTLACAAPEVESKVGTTAKPQGLMTVLSFRSENSSTELEQDYLFAAEVSGLRRKARGWSAQIPFVREFSAGMAMDEVVRFIQTELSAEYLCEPSRVAWAERDSDSRWSISLSIGDGIELADVRFTPVDAVHTGQIELLRTEVAPGANVVNRGLTPEQVGDWQGGRGIDPWIISEGEYLDQGRRGAGFSGFIELGFGVFGGKPRR